MQKCLQMVFPNMMCPASNADNDRISVPPLMSDSLTNSQGKFEIVGTLSSASGFAGDRDWQGIWLV